MKLFLLSALLLFSLASVQAQQVQTLPSGKYETVIKNNGKWEKGDILLLDEGRYRVTSATELGEYRFSATAQRVFFTSGPLKGVYARTTLTNNAPSILLPQTENEQLGLRLAPADIVGSLRRQ
jgi:hypothetical protein